MTETDIDDQYCVEHDEDFSMTAEQLQKLIRQKFERNDMLDYLRKREELLEHR